MGLFIAAILIAVAIAFIGSMAVSLFLAILPVAIFATIVFAIYLVLRMIYPPKSN